MAGFRQPGPMESLANTANALARCGLQLVVDRREGNHYQIGFTPQDPYDTSMRGVLIMPANAVIGVKDRPYMPMLNCDAMNDVLGVCLGLNMAVDVLMDRRGRYTAHRLVG